MPTRRSLLSAATAMLGAALPLPAFGQSRPSPGPNPASSPGANPNPSPGPTAISVTRLGRLAIVRGAGCNVVALAGDDGALMIDGGLRRHADALLDAVLRTTQNASVDLLINTHWHPEQTGANELVGRAGGEILAHEKTALFVSNAAQSALSAGIQAALPEAALPSIVVREDGSVMFDGLQIDYGYLPAAHTDGDIYVHFPELDVLVAGGVVSAESWPLIDYRSGAWYGGRVRALEWLAQIVSADTTVIPAHGATLSGRDVVAQRDIYQTLFETMIDYMNMGFGPEDVVARNPLAPYRDEFGDAAAFLDGAYRSMLIAYVPD